MTEILAASIAHIFNILTAHKHTSPLDFVVCLAPLAHFGLCCLVCHQRWDHSHMTPARWLLIFYFFCPQEAKHHRLKAPEQNKVNLYRSRHQTYSQFVLRA